MNILFFLTPKEEVAHVEEDDTLRQVVEKLEYHGYSAIPLLALDGKYIGTITEGDEGKRFSGCPSHGKNPNYRCKEAKRQRGSKNLGIHGRFI